MNGMSDPTSLPVATRTKTAKKLTGFVAGVPFRYPGGRLVDPSDSPRLRRYPHHSREHVLGIYVSHSGAHMHRFRIGQKKQFNALEVQPSRLRMHS